jgi:hypothetical protein
MGYDAFAVTVDGTLISLVPDGGTAISTRSIHTLIPAFSSAFTMEGQLDAVRDHLFLKDSIEISAAAGPSTQVEFDGMTVRLRLHAFVSTGVHTVRVSIADRDYPNESLLNQARFDSGVFLHTGSLRTIAPTP